MHVRIPTNKASAHKCGKLYTCKTRLSNSSTRCLDNAVPLSSETSTASVHPGHSSNSRTLRHLSRSVFPCWWHSSTILRKFQPSWQRILMWSISLLTSRTWGAGSNISTIRVPSLSLRGSRLCKDAWICSLECLSLCGANTTIQQLRLARMERRMMMSRRHRRQELNLKLNLSLTTWSSFVRPCSSLTGYALTTSSSSSSMKSLAVPTWPSS